MSLERDGDTRLIALERPITHIGRGLIADVRLEDSQVSRRHAILALRRDGARILDDRSFNGTFVNGRRVIIQHLTDGDVLRFGRAVFRFTEIILQRSPEPLRPSRLARRRGPPRAVGLGGGKETVQWTPHRGHSSTQALEAPAPRRRFSLRQNRRSSDDPPRSSTASDNARKDSARPGSLGVTSS